MKCGMCFTLSGRCACSLVMQDWVSMLITLLIWWVGLVCKVSMLYASFIPRPVEAEEEKGPGFSCSRMRIIITYLSTCTCGVWWKMTFRCHMVSSPTSFVYCKLEQHAYLRARITMCTIEDCPLSLCVGLLL